MSDEKPGREDDSLLAEPEAVSDAAELAAADEEVAAEARADEGKVSATPARRRRGRITADDEDDELVDATSVRGRRAASARTSPARAGTGTRSRAEAERARAQEIRQRRSVQRFLREVVAELRKVIWPGRRELITYTIVVIIFVAFIIALVSGLDLLFAKGVLTVFG